MPITVIQGLPGAGKSLKLARAIMLVLERNKRWAENKKHNPTGIKRKLYTNLALAEHIKKHYAGFIEEWTNTEELVRLRDVDVVWDEIATALDATQWQNMSLELKRWLQQHRKFGIEIYGTTQDFAQVDKSFRRLVSDLVHIVKLVGSRDKSATMPPIKHIWGLCLIRRLDPQQYDEGKSAFVSDGSLPEFMIFTRADVEVYDTCAEVKLGSYPPLRHISRSCENAMCTHVKTMHV
jgi:hypothetical protein